MDPPTLPPTLLPNLSSQIDTLTSTLHPLLTTPLSTTTSTLPLLSRAKLHIHLAYTIESLLYSSLLLSGQNPKEHAIFAELARLKGYFQKVKEIEERGLKGEGGEKEKEKEEGRMRLDKDAAGRFVRAGLAGNEQFDREREEREKGIRERAKRKADALAEKEKQRKHIKFDEEEESRRMAALPKEKREEADDDDDDDDDDDEDEDEDEDEGDEDQNEEMQDAINAAYDESNPFRSMPVRININRPKRLDERRSDIRGRKLWKRAQRAADSSNSSAPGEEEVLIPAKQQQGAPRTPGETFKALLEGPLKKGGKEDGKGKGKGTGKGKGKGKGRGRGKGK